MDFKKPLYNKKVQVMFSKQLHKAMIKRARELGISMNELIRAAVRKAHDLED